MFFDRFDICEAHYLYYLEWHAGQASREYEKLSRMHRYFRPSPLLSYDNLTENSKEIYDNLVRKHQHTSN